MKRRTMWLAMMLALVLVVAACSSDSDDDTTTTAASGETTETTVAAATETTVAAATETTVASDMEAGPIWVLLPDSATSPRWETDDRRFFEEAFTEAGIEFSVVNAEGDAQTQQAQAEQAINAGASVIVLTSLDTGSGAAIIDLAKAEGVAVIEYDRFNTGSSGGAVYVSFDNVAVGATMAEVLTPDIDAIGDARVVMLNGGEEDNNAFLFRDGYFLTVEEKVAAGDWTLVDDQFVPGWGGGGEGVGIMDGILVASDNGVDAVFAANDNLAQQAITSLLSAGLDPTTIPISGQDASVAGFQNIVLGLQTMTVYKPIEAEAKIAAAAALNLRDGGDGSTGVSVPGFEFTIIGIDSATGKPAALGGDGIVPYVALVPIGVTVDNITDTVIADGFRTVEEICVGDAAETAWCADNS
ncbi:MAG: substrate-binding domain-containing protein [Actinomycetia bacterium]|nr:substrate-binding domain-containing protein [Actinomycetes bacterium]